MTIKTTKANAIKATKDFIRAKLNKELSLIIRQLQDAEDNYDRLAFQIKYIVWQALVEGKDPESTNLLATRLRKADEVSTYDLSAAISDVIEDLEKVVNEAVNEIVDEVMRVFRKELLDSYDPPKRPA